MSGVAAQLVRDTGDHTEKKKEKKKLQMAENYTIKSIQNKHMYMVYWDWWLNSLKFGLNIILYWIDK